MASLPPREGGILAGVSLSRWEKELLSDFSDRMKIKKMSLGLCGFEKWRQLLNKEHLKRMFCTLYFSSRVSRKITGCF